MLRLIKRSKDDILEKYKTKNYLEKIPTHLKTNKRFVTKLINYKNKLKNIYFVKTEIKKSYEHFLQEEFLINVYLEKFQYSKTRGLDGKKGSDLKIESYGKRTSDISWLLRKLKNNRYVFHSFQEILVSKGKGKNPRIISKATVRDSLAIYTAKEYFKKNIQGSITVKANDLIQDVISNLSNISDIKDYVFYQTDITNYYGSINHNLLIEKISRILEEDPKKEILINLIKTIIENPTVEFGSKKLKKKVKNKNGIPQGLSVSNILANLYMLEFDYKMNYFIKNEEYGMIGYYRYVDDILIICKKTEFSKMESMFKNEIKRYKLELHKDKTELVDLSKGDNKLDFLGYVFSYKNGYQSKHLKLSNFVIIPRERTASNFLKSILSLFTKFKRNLEEINKLKSSETKTKRKKLLKINFVFRLNIAIAGCISSGNRFGFFTYFSKVSTPFLAYQVKNLIEKELEKIHTKKVINSAEKNSLKKKIKNPISCFFSTQNESFFRRTIEINFDEYMNYQEYVKQIGKEKTQTETNYYNSLKKLSPEDFLKKYDKEHYEHLIEEYEGFILRNKIYFYFNKMKQKNLDILSKDIKGSIGNY